MKKIFLTVLLGALSAAAFAAEDAELNFYQRQAMMKGATSKQDRALAGALARQAKDWFFVHPEHAEAKTALLMQADYFLRAREEGEALVALYQVRFYFPSEQDLTLLSSNVEKAAEGLDGKQKAQALKLLAVNTQGMSAPQKQAVLLETLVKGNLKGVYEPVNVLFSRFFAQNPSYEGNDKLTLLRGDWHRQNGNFLAAVAEYKKVNELFEYSPYKAAGLRMSADVYAGDLQDYETATSLYHQVLKQYPQSNERGVVYKHLAVMEENRKDYPAALAYYDKAIADLGSRAAAYDAWRGKADVQTRMKDYRLAYETLLRAADLFSADENNYTDALNQAASVAKNRLKDLSLQSAALEKILLLYPAAPKAPEIMYDLAYSYEKQNKAAQAVEAYKRLIIQYPTDKYADRAQGRLSRLEK